MLFVEGNAVIFSVFTAFLLFDISATNAMLKTVFNVKNTTKLIKKETIKIIFICLSIEKQTA